MKRSEKAPQKLLQKLLQYYTNRKRSGTLRRQWHNVRSTNNVSKQ